MSLDTRQIASRLQNLRLVAFLSGLAHVTLPFPTSKNDSLNELWVLGGENTFLIAVDTEGDGHKTTYPSDQTTVILQIPFKSISDMPSHEVVAPGPCYFAPSGSQIVQ